MGSIHLLSILEYEYLSNVYIVYLCENQSDSPWSKLSEKKIVENSTGIWSTFQLLNSIHASLYTVEASNGDPFRTIWVLKEDLIRRNKRIWLPMQITG